MEKHNVKKVRFDFLSNEAARLEREKDYKTAMDVWTKAKDSATKQINVDWCDARLRFCGRMVTKPFNED